MTYNIYYNNVKINNIAVSQEQIDQIKMNDIDLVRKVDGLPEIKVKLKDCKLVRCIQM